MGPDTSPIATAPAVPVRYDYLDALRGLAFLGVVSIHAAAGTGQRFAGERFAAAGKYGVQLFFIISAFTIFLTLDRARWRGWWTCGEFFVRRFFRILPMFWVGLALYAFVPGRASTYAGFRFNATDYLLTASLQHGWSPRLCNSMVPGGWSIAVEAAFYLVAPLCFRAVRNGPAAGWFLLGSLAFCEAAKTGAAALYFGGHLFAGDPRSLVGSYLYCWFPTQLPVFAVGMVVYHLVRQLERQPWSRSAGALLLVASALWLGASVDIGKHGWLPEHVFFALGFGLLVVGLKIWPTVILVNPATRFLGKVSYSAYLLHFAVLEAASNSLATFFEPEWQDSLPAFAALYVLTLLGTAPLAWLAHRCVERPCIDLGAKLIRRHRAAMDTASPAPGTPELVAAGH